MTIIDEMEQLIYRKECQKKNHEWEYQMSHTHIAFYTCKHCSAHMEDPEDCYGG